MKCSIAADSLLQPETIGLPGGITPGTVHLSAGLCIFGSV